MTPNQASNRLRTVRIRYLTVCVLFVISVALFVEIGLDAAITVLSLGGIASMGMVIAAYLLETQLWKTKIGRMVGFPPDYSGDWKGTVTRKYKGGETENTVMDISVKVIQNVTDIQWIQTHKSTENTESAASALLIGCVIDLRGDWAGVTGIFEVEKGKGQKYYGMMLLQVSDDGTTMKGIYNNSVGGGGIMEVKKVL